MPKRLIVIDEQPITRAGIAAVLARRPDLTVVGQAATVDEALKMVRELEPDLAITDLTFRPGIGGCELVKTLRECAPGLRVLVLSAHDEDLYGERALAAGAMGYLMKRAPLTRLLEAVDRVLAGQTYASAELLERFADRLARRSKAGNSARPEAILSQRELQVLELIGRGVGTREIANRLNLSVKTVETHRAHLKTKLALESAPQLVRFAVQWLAAGDTPANPPAVA